ncbi:MAG: bacteriocin maturation protein, partial [Bacillus sp. (in: firmicutes)]
FQNPEANLKAHVFKVSSLLLEEKVGESIVIPACDDKIQSSNLQTAMEVLERNHKRLSVFEQEIEPFLKEGLAGVFGVLLREEGSR